MPFTFLHTADWQLGKAFGGFAAEKASLLKRARLTAVDRLADAARGAGAADVVVCGDVFDGPGLPDRALLEAKQKLANHPDIAWHLLPGNHDPAQADGIWQRISASGLPANVRLMLAAEPVTIAPGVVLLPAPLTAKTLSHDPTAWMDRADTPAGALRIGVAHGSTQGFGSAGVASVGIAPSRRASARLDYLALGDWHGMREVAAGVWYSGTPEPDQFPDNKPGFALAVSIDGAGAVPRVRPVATAQHTWLKRTLRVTAAADLAGIEAEVAAFGADRSNVLLELTLHGRLSLVADAAVTARLVDLDAGLFHLAVRRDGLALDAGGDDIAGLDDRQLVRIAGRLEAMRAGGDTAMAAEGALRRLFTFARQAQDKRP